MDKNDDRLTRERISAVLEAVDFLLADHPGYCFACYDECPKPGFRAVFNPELLDCEALEVRKVLERAGLGYVRIWW